MTRMLSILIVLLMATSRILAGDTVMVNKNTGKLQYPKTFWSINGVVTNEDLKSVSNLFTIITGAISNMAYTTQTNWNGSPAKTITSGNITSWNAMAASSLSTVASSGGLLHVDLTIPNVPKVILTTDTVVRAVSPTISLSNEAAKAYAVAQSSNIMYATGAYRMSKSNEVFAMESLFTGIYTNSGSNYGYNANAVYVNEANKYLLFINGQWRIYSVFPENDPDSPPDLVSDETSSEPLNGSKGWYYPGLPEFGTGHMERVYSSPVVIDYLKKSEAATNYLTAVNTNSLKSDIATKMDIADLTSGNTNLLAVFSGKLPTPSTTDLPYRVAVTQYFHNAEWSRLTASVDTTTTNTSGGWYGYNVHVWPSAVIQLSTSNSVALNTNDSFLQSCLLTNGLSRLTVIGKRLHSAPGTVDYSLSLAPTTNGPWTTQYVYQISATYGGIPQTNTFNFTNSEPCYLRWTWVTNSNDGGQSLNKAAIDNIIIEDFEGGVAFLGPSTNNAPVWRTAPVYTKREVTDLLASYTPPASGTGYYSQVSGMASSGDVGFAIGGTNVMPLINSNTAAAVEGTNLTHTLTIINSNLVTATVWTPTTVAWAISNVIDYTIGWQSYYPTDIGTNYLDALSPTNAGCTFRFDIYSGSNTSWNTNNLLWDIGIATNASLIFDWDRYLMKWRVGFLFGRSL